MKYRAGGTSKIKYEHGMIPGLRKFLQKIEPWEEIISIIPGRIKPVNSSRKLYLKVQYETLDGLKCLAHGRAVVQEVFIVSGSSMELWDRLEMM